MYPLKNPTKLKLDIPKVNTKSKLTSYFCHVDQKNFLEVCE